MMRKRSCGWIAALLLPALLVSCGRLDNAVEVLPVADNVFQPPFEDVLPDEWTIAPSDSAVPDRSVTEIPETEAEDPPETEDTDVAELETDAPAAVPSEEPEEAPPETTAVNAVPVTETPPAQTTAKKPPAAAKPVTTEAKTEPYEAIPPAVSDHRATVIINTSSGKYHLYASCSGVKSMNEANKLVREVDSLSQLDAAGYVLCSKCAKTLKAEQEAAAAAAAVTDPPIQTTVPPREAPAGPEQPPEVPADGGAPFAFEGTVDVVLNTNSKKIHLDPACRYVSTMKETNRQDLAVTAEELNALIASGYALCKGCGGP